MSSQRFCLRWNNHQTNMLSVFDQLLHAETFTDVTLAIEGQYLKAHKVSQCVITQCLSHDVPPRSRKSILPLITRTEHLHPLITGPRWAPKKDSQTTRGWTQCGMWCLWSYQRQTTHKGELSRPDKGVGLSRTRERVSPVLSVVCLRCRVYRYED